MDKIINIDLEIDTDGLKQQIDAWLGLLDSHIKKNKGGDSEHNVNHFSAYLAVKIRDDLKRNRALFFSAENNDDACSAYTAIKINCGKAEVVVKFFKKEIKKELL